jgi:ureidoglycolate hydrolase
VTVRPEPLTPESFAPYGKVLDQEPFVLTSTYFPFFSNVATLKPTSEPITYINRHHDHNQIFATLGGDQLVVVVAPPQISAAELDPSNIKAFITDGQTAFVFHVDTWHLEPRGVGPHPVRALNVQATNLRVHTERVELDNERGYLIQLDV